LASLALVRETEGPRNTRKKAPPEGRSRFNGNPDDGSNQKLGTIPALNPLGRLAAARPRLAGSLIAVFRGHFTQRFTPVPPAAGKYVIDRKTVLLHLGADFGEDFRNFAAASILNLKRQHLLLFQKFL
jgi:hypothetical protein